MTTTFITTSNIVTGTAHDFLASGDELYVARDVFWGSENGSLFFETSNSLTDLRVHIAGETVQNLQSFISGDRAQIVIAATASLTSFLDASSNVTIQTSGADSTIINHGVVSSLNSIGLFSAGGTSTITNTGSIEASSAVFIGFVGAGDAFFNSGSVLSNNYDDDVRDNRHNNGVYAGSANNVIVNYAEGTITATSSEGAGIKFLFGAGGSSLTNAGTITSVQAWGVDLAEVNSFQGVITTVNTGTIQGGTGSYLGSVNDDDLVNFGLMIGDVDMGDGADIYDARTTGEVLGEINGGAGNDTITGGVEADIIDGGTDNDRIKAMGGDDIIKGGDGVDNIFAGEGNDEIIAGKGDDMMRGGLGDDTLTGGAGKDVLRGGSGDDVLEGGKDEDVLTGGAGADIFLFKVATHSTSTKTDDITDFVQGTDLIDISAFGATFISNSGFSGTGGAEVRFGTGGGLTRFEVDTDGDGNADMRVDMGSIGGLSEADFIL